MKGVNVEKGYCLIVGALYPAWRHPWRRIMQEVSLMRTPGMRLRVRMERNTMIIFGSREDAQNCRMVMVWSGNPCGEEIRPCEFDIEARRVWVHDEERGIDDGL